MVQVYINIKALVKCIDHDKHVQCYYICTFLLIKRFHAIYFMIKIIQRECSIQFSVCYPKPLFCTPYLTARRVVSISSGIAVTWFCRKVGLTSIKNTHTYINKKHSHWTPDHPTDLGRLWPELYV